MIVDHLQMMTDLRKGMHIPEDYKYCCMEEFVLQHGQVWVPQPSLS
jgi:hypothetical protein